MWIQLRPILVTLTGLFLFGQASGSAADSGFSLLLRPETRELEVRHKARPVLVYSFGTNQYKPYVRELYTLDGFNVLQDAPADHLHHHGLMYAIRVNGINFWEETAQSGHQIPRGELTREVRHDPRGRHEARFSQEVFWVPPGAVGTPDPAPFALLNEVRTITVTVQPDTEEIAVQWRSDFELGPAAQEVTLTGASYHGLGLRLSAEFDSTARRQNSAGLPFLEEGRDQVHPAYWIAASESVAGRPYTVALFHHPGNAGLQRVFSMVNAFAYLSATQGLDEAPLEYKSGDRFTVRHLVTITPGRLADSALERQYRLWSQ
jgi:hypothetical protein